MKRLSSSDSLGPMISICPSAEEKGSSGGSNAVYNRGFQPVLDGLDEEDCVEESGHIAEKKRRLSIEQVKALEKNFEVENKLEPERKVKLAQELGLQPRQVAVWFQNRRARWKTKQLERDYGILKANYEALKLNYDALHHDKEALLVELRELKSKLQDEKPEINHPIKQEIDTIHSQSLAESEKKMPDGINVSTIGGIEGSEIVTDPNLDQYKGVIFGDLKDGSSDSDSSAILNDENSPNAAISSEMFPQMILYPSSSSSCGLRYSCSSSPAPPITCMQKAYHQFLRMDESSLSSFLNPEEACDFFSEEQAPTLPWYGSDAWD